MKLFCVFVALYSAARAANIPTHDDQTSPQNPDLDFGLAPANASLVEEFSDEFEDGLPGISPMTGQKPMHWPVPHYFKRQNCNANNQNFCYPGISNVWCSCTQICCYDTTGKRFCCPTGYTCDLPRSQCIEAIATITIASTTSTTTFSTRTVYQTNGATTTSLAIITRVFTVTISSAQTATVIATVTISSPLAKREQAYLATRTGHVIAQATETTGLLVPNGMLSVKEKVPLPQVTSRPVALDKSSTARPKKKRTVTSTLYSTTRTIYFTSTVDYTSSASFLSTSTSSTTIFQTTTVFVNAQATVRSTITTNIADSRPPSSSTASTTTSIDSNTNNSNNNNNNNDNGGGGLGKGAKIGIGAGVAGGALVICIIAGFFLARRRKQRKIKNQAKIDSAVAAAVAGGAHQSPQQHDKTPNYAHSPEPYAMSTFSHNTYASEPQSTMTHKPELHGTSAPSYPPISNYGAPPGHGQPGYYQFNQPETYQAYAPGVYQTHSPEMPASPVQRHSNISEAYAGNGSEVHASTSPVQHVQHPHELPGQPGSPVPVAPQPQQYGYLPQGHGYSSQGHEFPPQGHGYPR